MKAVRLGVACVLLLAYYIRPSVHAQGNNTDSSTTGTVIPQQVIEVITNIKVKVLLESPYVQRTSTDPTKFEGIFIDILEQLTTRLNLTYTISLQDDLMYGYEEKPGDWTGLIGSLQDNISDLAVAPLTLRSNRQNIVDYSLPVMSSGLRILYKVPDGQSENEPIAILLKPFTVGLWVVILLMFIAVSVLFYLIGRFSPYEDAGFVGKAATYEGLTLVNSFLYVFSSLTFQGYTAAPRSISGRFLAAFWWMFTMLVIAAYTASLAAIFLNLKPSIQTIPFDTFDELSRQTKVSFGMVANGSSMQYLKNSNRPLQKRLWSIINSHGSQLLVKNVNEGAMRVQNSDGMYALIVEGPVAEYLSEQPPCSLMTIGEPLSEHSYAFACRKNTDLCSKLNVKILELQEQDVVYDIKNKWMHRGCLKKDGGEYIFQGLPFFDTFGGVPDFFADRTVTLRRFGMGFIVLFIGMVTSACILVAEIFIAKRRGIAVPQRIPTNSAKSDREPIDREFRDEI